MFTSRFYSKSVLGLFGLITLLIITASSVALTVNSASQTASGLTQRGSDRRKSAKTYADADKSDSTQEDAFNIRRVSLPSNDIVYNPLSQTIYASVPSSAGSIGNSLTQINPKTGAIVTSVFIGSEPNKLALSGDGQTLYTSLSGANAIRRFDTAAQTPGIQFSVGQDSSYGGYLVNDLAVAPDNPNTVAVVRYYSGISPPEAGVAIFDNGVQRPKTGPGHIAGSDFIAYSNSSSTLFGGGYYDGLRVMTIDATGVASITNTAFSVGARIKYDNGLIFTSIGQVIDANTKTLLGVFSGASSNAFVSDKAAGRAFYVVKDSSYGNTLTLKAFDINTFTPVGSITIPNVTGDPTSLVRWGANGLAFRTSDNQIFFIQTSLIPSSEPIPTVTPSPSATPTPTPTPFNAFVRQVSLTTNDLVYNSVTQKIYASVPSSAGVGMGNSMTEIDPLGGTIGKSISVGSEPNKLALADDSKTVYVGLDGAASVRKVDVIAQTAGLQFPISVGNTNGETTAVDISVQPGMPGTVAVSRGYYTGIAVFDEGIRRPLTNGSGPVEFTSPTTLYSGSTNNSGSIAKLLLGANGVTLADTINVGYTNNLYDNNFYYENGLLYTSRGKVIDVATNTLKGTFPVSDTNNSMAIDSGNNRAFFASYLSSGNGYIIRSFELDTFRPVGSVTLSGVSGASGFPTSLVRWGTNGLAFRNSNNQVFLIQTNLVNVTDPVPTPTPTVSPTPTPTPTDVPTFIRRVNLPVNDLIYNDTTQSIYASVASVAGAGVGNTISQIIPQSGETVSSVFVGSEPNKLAAADDGHTLYVKLDGVNAIRRFDTVAKTAGLQFPLDSSYQFQDMDVMPGSPQTLAVAVRYTGVIIYDNGVARPNTSNGGAYSINTLDFSDSASTLYGYDSESSGFELVKFAVDASGVKKVSSVGNLISGYSGKIKYANGLLYTTSGRVIDPETQRLIGTFQTGGTAMAIDTTLKRIFFLNNNVLTAYDLTTFVKIGSVTLSGVVGTPTSLVRWGTNGLAFRASSSTYGGTNDSQLYLVQSELVSTATPIPTGVQLAATGYSTYEGSSNIAVTVTRTGNTSIASSVDYATSDGTATAGSDYTAVSGTLNFAAGESSKNITIPIINDTVYEGSETFNLTLGNQTSNTSILYPNSAVITIQDNDSTPNISASNITVNEPAAGSTAAAVFTVKLSNPSTQTITVNYATANGTATAGSDYVATSGSLTFAPLETSKNVTVTVNGDNNNEGDETFSFTLSSAVNAQLYSPTVTATVKNYTPPPARATLFDFDGDGKADVSVFRPSNGVWYFQNSTAGFSAVQFGIAADNTAPADYDGDGKTDIAVFRAGNWYLQRSTQGFAAIQFGSPGDIPMPGDFDGDGRAELVVYRPSNGYWYVLNLANNQFSSVQFGNSEDKPIAADYDGDGKADYAVYRPSTGVWYLLQSSKGFAAIQFGIATDKPVIGDYDGDGRTDQAVYRAESGTWYLFQSTKGFAAIQFGLSTDLPAPADFDGDGKTDIAVFRPETGNWYQMKSLQGFGAIQFGSNGDKPTANAFAR